MSNIINFVDGSNALSLDCDFYSIIQKNYNNTKKLIEDNNMPFLNSSIFMLQQIYIDLVNIDKIDILGVPIRFSDDYWDLTSLQKDGKHGYLYHFDFGSDGDNTLYARNVLKLYVLYMIYEHGIHRSSNKSDFLQAASLFKYMKENNILSMASVTPNVLAKFITSKNTQYNTQAKIKASIKHLFTFFSLIAEDVYTVEIETYLSNIDRDKIHALTEEHKTKLLPSSFVQKYRILLKEIVFDDSFLLQDRGMAGLIYIGTQTGLRPGELCLLQKDCLIQQELNGMKIGMLKYLSTKNGGKKDNIYNEGITNASESVIEVIKKLRELYDPLRPKDVSLLVFYAKSFTKEKCQGLGDIMTPQNLEIFQRRMCIQYRTRLGTLNSPDADMFENTMTADDLKKRYPEMYFGFALTDSDTISCPIAKQFRVYFASELHERGVDYKTISYLLNHKTEEMWGYYVRPKHQVQEDIDFSKEVVAEIIKDNTKILGPKGDAIREKIDVMIKENSFNIVDDFEAIIDMVCNEMPIRAKEGGFCIKSNPRRQCRHDADTDEFLCAYGCCPNHCHFYFSAHISYRKCVDIKKCADYNNEQGYRNQAQKELYKLDAVMKQELIPELDELEVQLTKKSAEKIIQIHPDLEPIISNLSTIRKEIEAWKNEIAQI